MSNSKLVDCTVYSPNHSGKRTHTIDTLTPHCVVGHASAERIGACFPAGRQASCNYGIGYDGRVCLIVDECNRSWCTSSNANDQRAITIECASDTTEPYAMNSAVYEKLVELCADICKRNGKNKVLWLGSKEKTLAYEPKSNEMVLTAHRWFANKSCPGEWLYSRYGDLANRINALLGTDSNSNTGAGSANTDKTLAFKVGDVVQFTGSKHYTSANATSGPACKAGKAEVTAVYPTGKHPYHLIRVSGSGSTVWGWVDADNVKEYNEAQSFKVGDKVKCNAGVTKYSNGARMASWVPSSVLYVRQVESGGKILLVSTEPTKKVYTGRANAADMHKI